MEPTSLGDLVEATLGARTVSDDNRTVSTIGATAAQILRQTPTRVAFTIVNMSAFDMWVGPFNNVASTKGIWLSPNGGSLALNYKEDFDLVGLEWFGIAGGAGASILTLETFLDKKQEQGAQPVIQP